MRRTYASYDLCTPAYAFALCATAKGTSFRRNRSELSRRLSTSSRHRGACPHIHARNLLCTYRDCGSHPGVQQYLVEGNALGGCTAVRDMRKLLSSQERLLALCARQARPLRPVRAKDLSSGARARTRPTHLTVYFGHAHPDTVSSLRVECSVYASAASLKNTKGDQALAGVESLFGSLKRGLAPLVAVNLTK